MDPETSRKISELANNLKKLHLAATMEEAMARAKEMILGAPTNEKPIGELMKAQEIKKEEKDIQKAEESLEELEKQIKHDEALNKSQEPDIKETKEETEKLKKGIENAKDIIEEAERVQD